MPKSDDAQKRKTNFTKKRETHPVAARTAPTPRPAPTAYQFPTVNSVTILHVLMVLLDCICGAEIVHATQHLRIPRSDCRFDLWNPAFWPRTRRPSSSAEHLVARQQAECRVKSVQLIGRQRRVWEAWSIHAPNPKPKNNPQRDCPQAFHALRAPNQRRTDERTKKTEIRPAGKQSGQTL